MSTEIVIIGVVLVVVAVLDIIIIARFVKQNMLFSNVFKGLKSLRIDTTDSHRLYIPDKRANSVMQDIVKATNTYLRSMEEANAEKDYELIKEIARRRINNYEQELASLVPMSIYIGLGASFAGIIITFIVLASGNAMTGTDFQMFNLLGGIGLAMTASLFGILISLILMWSLKNARKKVETGYIEYIEKLQNTLLPVLKRDMQQTMRDFSKMLDQFNTHFTQTIQTFDSMLGENIQTIVHNTQEQNELLDRVQNVNITKVANANLKVFKALDESVDKLERFSGYQDDLQRTMDRANELIGQFNQMMARDQEAANTIGELHGTLSKQAHATGELVGSLQAQTQSLQDYNETYARINSALNDVHESLEKSETNVQKTLNNFEEKIENMFNKNAEYLENSATQTQKTMGDFEQGVEDVSKEHLKQLEQHLKQSLKTFDDVDEKINEHINKIQKAQKGGSNDKALIKELKDHQRETNRLLEDINANLARLQQASVPRQPPAPEVRAANRPEGEDFDGHDGPSPGGNGSFEKRPSMLRRLSRFFSKNLATLASTPTSSTTAQPQVQSQARTEAKPKAELQELFAGAAKASQQLFPNDRIYLSETDSTFFRIEYTEDASGAIGEFRPLESPEKVIKAINGYKNILEPSCKILDWPGQEKIEVIEPGEVQYTSSGWEITKKAQIKIVDD